MSQSWTYDAPSGVFKNHALSAQIRFAAIAQCKFMQFVNAESGFGKKKGENVTITRVSNVAVPTSDVLVEQERIPEDTISITTQSITALERGRAIPYTSLDVDLSYMDIENAIQKKLRDQLSLSMDSVAASASKVGKIKAYLAGTSSITFTTNGTAGGQSVVNLNTFHVEAVRDYLFSTLNCAPYSGDDYMCLLATKGKRGIIRDPQWIDWKKYTDPEAKYNGEIGKYENCRFIEVNNTAALSGSLGSGSVQGESVFFGDDPLAMAVVQEPELRAKESEDYGRSKGVAWYGIYGIDQIWKDSANAGEARLVHVTST